MNIVLSFDDGLAALATGMTFGGKNGPRKHELQVNKVVKRKRDKRYFLILSDKRINYKPSNE